MIRRQTVLLGVLGCVVLFGAAAYYYLDAQDVTRPARAVAPAAKKPVTTAELAEIRGYLDAEKIADGYDRCVAYPNPSEFKWDPAVVDAACRQWQLKRLSYKEIAAAVEGHHPEILREAFDGYLAKTYEPGQHGFLVWAFRMFNNWSKEQGELLDKWVEMDPASAYALTARGLHHVAVAFHERGTKYARDTSREQFARMAENAELARGDLERALHRNPRLLAAHHGMLKVAQLQSDAELHARISRAALELDPADATLYNELIDILEPQWGGSIEEMGEVAAMALKQADKNPLLRLTPARIACFKADRLVCADCGSPDTLKQRQHDAFELYRSAGRDGPAECFLEGMTYASQVEGVEASLARAYSQSYRFLGSGQPVLDRALVLQRIGKADWALESLDRLLEAWPRYVDAHIYRGYVLQGLHRGREAQQAFAKAYELDPTSWDATRNLVGAYVEIVHEPAKAREIVDRMMAETPRNPRVWLLEASLHKAGEEAKCRDALRKYLELVDPRTEDAADRFQIEKASKRVAELDRLLGR